MSWQPVAPAYPMPRRRTSWLFWVTSIVLGVGALAIASLILLAGEPVAAAVGLLLAAIPVPILLWFYLWLDSHEPEPRRYLVAGLGWGAVVATTFAVVFTALGAELSDVRGRTIGVVWAPLTEELGKGLFLLVVVLLRRRELHGLLDGIVYAGMVGIGFAFTENLLYYMQSYVGDEITPGGLSAATGLFFLRGVISPFAHPLFTSAIGIGLGCALMARSWSARITAPLIGYAVAVALHSAWNASALLGGPSAFLLTYLVAMLPALALVLGIALWVRRQEGRVLVAALQDCARMGWLHPDEIPWVASPSYRAAARAFARRMRGPDGERAVREYQRALVEMGFLHERVMRGQAPGDAAQRMAEIRFRMAMWRPYVVLPPPLRTAGMAAYGQLPGF